MGGTQTSYWYAEIFEHLENMDMSTKAKKHVLQLDWMSIGDGMPVQAMMNGLQFTPSISNTTGTGTRAPNVTTTTSGGAVTETSQVRSLPLGRATTVLIEVQATVPQSASSFPPSAQLDTIPRLAALFALALLFIL